LYKAKYFSWYLRFFATVKKAQQVLLVSLMKKCSAKCSYATPVRFLVGWDCCYVVNSVILYVSIMLRVLF